MDLERAAHELTERKVLRRGLLAGAAALAVGAVSRLTAKPAEAVDPQDVDMNTVNVSTGETQLNSAAAGGSGYTVLRVENFRLGDAIRAIGGPGTSANAGRSGLIAEGGDNPFGTNVTPRSAGHGVQATGGSAVGGIGTGGSGLKGTGGPGGTFVGGFGVEGTGGSPLGAGVFGTGGGTVGSQGFGVLGITNSTSRAAVNGHNNGTGPGVAGDSNSGVGVSGTTTGGTGVYGETASSTNAGVFGKNISDGTGVRGESTTGFAVLGVGGSDNIGVKGVSNTGGSFTADGNGSGSGVQGKSTGGPGVEGISVNSLGVRGISANFVGIVGISTNSHGLYGSSSSGANGFGIVAENFGANGRGLLVSGSQPSQIYGGLQVFGTKNAVLKMQDGSFASVYCQESPEPYFEDFGRAQLAGGVANVPLEREFATLVAGGDYMVFPVPEGPSSHLFVSRRTPTGFEVREGNNGMSNVPFTYRIVTRRKDIEGRRFARVSTEAADKVAGARAMLSSMGTPGAPAPTPPFAPPVNPVAPNPTPPNPTPQGPTQPGTTGIGGVR